MRSNEDIYADLLQQARKLTAPQFIDEEDAAALRNNLALVLHLLDALIEGQDIMIARLAYDDNNPLCAEYPAFALYDRIEEHIRRGRLRDDTCPQGSFNK